VGQGAGEQEEEGRASMYAKSLTLKNDEAMQNL
jgi:hypothetical protein